MSTGEKTNIFIVDDDPMFLQMLKDHLSENNRQGEVWAFLNGEACLDRMEENPALVVLDYYLDGINKEAANGLEILKQIKELRPDIPVIMLSGQEKYGVAAQTILEGAIHYIIKDDSAFDEVNKLVKEIVEE